jgi:hypothetical protein
MRKVIAITDERTGDILVVGRMGDDVDINVVGEGRHDHGLILTDQVRRELIETLQSFDWVDACRKRGYDVLSQPHECTYPKDHNGVCSWWILVLFTHPEDL